jgi:hypothetical protein
MALDENRLEEQKLNVIEVDIKGDLDSFGQAVEDLTKVFEGTSEKPREEVLNTVQNLGLWKLLFQEKGDAFSIIKKSFAEINGLIDYQQKKREMIDNSRDRVFELIKNKKTEGAFPNRTNEQAFEDVKKPGFEDLRIFNLKLMVLLEAMKNAALFFVQKQKEESAELLSLSEVEMQQDYADFQKYFMELKNVLGGQGNTETMQEVFAKIMELRLVQLTLSLQKQEGLSPEKQQIVDRFSGAIEQVKEFINFINEEADMLRTVTEKSLEENQFSKKNETPAEYKKIDWSDVSKEDLEELFFGHSKDMEGNLLYQFFKQRYEELSPVAGKIIAQEELLKEKKSIPGEARNIQLLEKIIKDRRAPKDNELYEEWKMLQVTLGMLKSEKKITLLEEKGKVKLFLLNIYQFYSVQNVLTEK